MEATNWKFKDVGSLSKFRIVVFLKTKKKKDNNKKLLSQSHFLLALLKRIRFGSCPCPEYRSASLVLRSSCDGVMM